MQRFLIRYKYYIAACLIGAAIYASLVSKSKVEILRNQLNGKECIYSLSVNNECRRAAWYSAWTTRNYDQLCLVAAATCLQQMGEDAAPALPDLIHFIKTGTVEYDTGDGTIAIQPAMIAALTAFRDRPEVFAVLQDILQHSTYAPSIQEALGIIEKMGEKARPAEAVVANVKQGIPALLAMHSPLGISRIHDVLATPWKDSELTSLSLSAIDRYPFAAEEFKPEILQLLDTVKDDALWEKQLSEAPSVDAIEQVYQSRLSINSGLWELARVHYKIPRSVLREKLFDFVDTSPNQWQDLRNTHMLLKTLNSNEIELKCKKLREMAEKGVPEVFTRFDRALDDPFRDASETFAALHGYYATMLHVKTAPLPNKEKIERLMRDLGDSAAWEQRLQSAPTLKEKQRVFFTRVLLSNHAPTIMVLRNLGEINPELVQKLPRIGPPARRYDSESPLGTWDALGKLMGLDDSFMMKSYTCY